jgi:hypothetical protein
MNDMESFGFLSFLISMFVVETAVLAALVTAVAMLFRRARPRPWRVFFIAWETIALSVLVFIFLLSWIHQ